MIRKFIKHIVISIVALFIMVPATFTQSKYPVSVNPILMTPYTLNLSDYCAAGSQKLMVILQVNDLDISHEPVKLQIKIESIGITIENQPTIVTNPIFIDGGATHILYGQDLADYFNINNLVFQGYSKEDYLKAGQLPEGFYKFSISVLHYNNIRVISNAGTISTWIVVGKPPVLQYPLNNDNLGENNGMPLTFSWLSSNAGSVAAMGNIQYKFEMWEMQLQNINPNIVAATIPVFHEYVTYNTAYTFYPGTLIMEQGMQYAWRVTAFDPSGAIPFNQEGKSEIRTFVYKAACDSVSGLEAEASGRTGKFSWNTGPMHTSYNVEIRNPETGWLRSSETYENQASFFGLEYGTAYEIRIQSVCNSDPASVSDFTQWKSLTIPEPTPAFDSASCPNCGCDDERKEVEIENFDIRADLKIGDTISNKQETTRLLIKEITDNNNGTYKGVCYFWAEIWGLKIPCTFTNLQVNTDNVFVNLDLESINDPTFMIDVDAIEDAVESAVNNLTTLFEKPTDTSTVSGNIGTIFINEEGNVIIIKVDENGNVIGEVIYAEADDVENTLLQDEKGNKYVVTNKGEVMGAKEYEATNGSSNNIEAYNEKLEEDASPNANVQFTAATNQNYSFDAYTEVKAAIQNQYPKLTENYRPAYKSMASFMPDNVAISGYTDKTIFKDEMGIPATKIENTLNLIGGPDETSKSIYAFNKVNDTTDQVTGKLNIKSYTEETKTLYIVSVNGAQLPDEATLENDLNNIYRQAIIKWDVKTGNPLTDIAFEGEKMSHGGSGITSPYNNDQKTIINAYAEANPDMDKNDNYLFFVTEAVDKAANIAGYMPLSYNAGFIYGLPTNTTIAHELGHGAFNLYHTFSDKNNISPEGTTYNLMDYKGGSELWMYQWDYIHNPQTMLFAWAQDESEAEAAVDLQADWNLINYKGHFAILNYFLNEGYDDLVFELEIHDFFNYIPENPTNSEKEQFAFEAATIVENALGGSSIHVGDPAEALALLYEFHNTNVTKIFASKHDAIMELIYSNPISFPESLIVNKIRDDLTYADATATTVKTYIEHYNEIWDEVKNLDHADIRNFRNTLVESINSGTKSIIFTDIGLDKAVKKMSNTQFKRIYRKNFPDVTDAGMANIMQMRRTGTYPYSNFIAMLDDADQIDIINSLDDLSLSSLRTVDNFSILTTGMKIGRALDIAGPVFDFLQLILVVKNNLEVTPLDVLSVVPHPISIFAILGNMIIDDKIEEFNLWVWETSPTWDFVRDFDSKWRGEDPIPDLPLYICYTDQKERYNPNVEPTSIVIDDKTIATKVFGFTPTIADFDAKTQAALEAFPEGFVAFKPFKQVTY